MLGQQASDAEYLAARTVDLAALEDSVYERTSWDKYLECNALPDVTKEVSAGQRSGAGLVRMEAEDATTVFV